VDFELGLSPVVKRLRDWPTPPKTQVHRDVARTQLPFHRCSGPGRTSNTARRGWIIRPG
jgi:hypothetical protein